MTQQKKTIFFLFKHNSSSQKKFSLVQFKKNRKLPFTNCEILPLGEGALLMLGFGFPFGNHNVKMMLERFGQKYFVKNMILQMKPSVKYDLVRV